MICGPPYLLDPDLPSRVPFRALGQAPFRFLGMIGSVIFPCLVTLIPFFILTYMACVCYVSAHPTPLIILTYVRNEHSSF